MILVPDITTRNEGPNELYCSSIKFRKVKGKPTYNADFELQFAIGEAAETDIRLPPILQHARSVLVGALAGQPSGKIQSDPLIEGTVDLACLIDGAPESFVNDGSAILRRVTLHANAKNARVVYLLRVDITLALAEVILSCLDSDVRVVFTPRQTVLPLAPRVHDPEAGDIEGDEDDQEERVEANSAPTPAATTRRPSRRRVEPTLVEDLVDDLPAEA